MGGLVFDLLGDQKLKWHQPDSSISIAIFSLKRDLKIPTVGRLGWTRSVPPPEN